MHREIISERYIKEKEGCWVAPAIKGIDGMYHSRTRYWAWLTESGCVTCDFKWRFRLLPHVMDIIIRNDN